MKLVLLLTRDSYESKRLQEAALTKAVGLEKLYYQDLSLEIPGSLPAILEQADAVISRISTTGNLGNFVQVRHALLEGWPTYAAKWLNGLSYLNFPEYTKLSQLLLFTKQDLPVPRTWYGKDIARFSSFPLVVKGLHGNNGQQVHLVDNLDELLHLDTVYGKGNYLVQEYLPTREDYRVVVVGEKVVASMKKKSTSGFLTNIMAGGQALAVESERIEELSVLALQAMKVVGCTYGGVDIMYTKDGQPKLLEVNRGAGFEGVEGLTGVDIAGEIIDYLLPENSS